MKLYTIITIIFVFLLSACEEALIEKPRDIMNPDQFFNTDAEAISAVNGIYRRGVDYITATATYGANTRDFNYTSHWGTDIARPTGGRDKNFPQHVYTFSPAEDGGEDMRNQWLTYYRTIADANMVIARVEASKNNFSTEVYNQSIGQAKFLRAFFYYILTNYWGDVPMWLEELDIDKVSKLQRTPISEIYDQMVLDLTDAAEKLPSFWESSNIGRVNKWAAKVLLTKVYMLQNDWSNAKSTAGEIINDSPHTLMPEYGMIFGKENEYNNEIIWEVDALQNINPSILVARFTPRSKDEPTFTATEIDYEFNGFGLLTSTNEFIASFDPDDGRIPFYNFNGLYDDPDGDGVYDHWVQFNYRYVSKFCDWGSPRANSGLNTIIYRLADVYLMYAEAENELNGPTAEAYAKINAIRDRAFGNNPEKQLSGLSQEEFREAIMEERKWELAFEFHRRWDLKRWGKLGEAVQSISETNPIGAANFKPYHVLFPIPFQEIDLNPNLIQNLGYE